MAFLNQQPKTARDTVQAYIRTTCGGQPPKLYPNMEAPGPIYAYSPRPRGKPQYVLTLHGVEKVVSEYQTAKAAENRPRFLAFVESFRHKYGKPPAQSPPDSSPDYATVVAQLTRKCDILQTQLDEIPTLSEHYALQERYGRLREAHAEALSYIQELQMRLCVHNLQEAARAPRASAVMTINTDAGVLQSLIHKVQARPPAEHATLARALLLPLRSQTRLHACFPSLLARIPEAFPSNADLTAFLAGLSDAVEREREAAVRAEA
jgi:hypothetical protein